MVKLPLDKIIRKVNSEVIRYLKQEKALILSAEAGTNSYEVAKSFFDIFTKISPHVTWLVTPEKEFNDPMEDTVRQAILSDVDVIIQTNAKNIGSDKKADINPYDYKGNLFRNPLYFRKAKKDLRAFWFTVDDIDWFIRCLNINFNTLKKNSLILKDKLDAAYKVRIISDNGTDLMIDVSDPRRVTNCDFDGQQHLPGQGGNLPMGEIFISPVNTLTEGNYVIDGSFNTVFPWETVLIKKAVKLTFKEGQIVEINGGKEAKLFEMNLLEAEKRTRKLYTDGHLSRKLMTNYLYNTRAVGEFAFGLNRNAEIIGDLLIDEKRYGDAHIAIGRSYDGDPALIHMDCIVRQPSVELINPSGSIELVLNKGRYQLS